MMKNKYIYTYNELLLKENFKKVSYMLGNVKYLWIKNEIKKISGINSIRETRLDILSKRKKELRLDEFQTLYDYWNFCNEYSGKIVLANNPIENYKSHLKEWIMYLVILQLFPEDLKNAKRDFYTMQYNEILSLPKLIGDFDRDKIIFEDAVRNFILCPSSITRQSIITYSGHFKYLF